MENLAKQARSRKRIEKIFETAENLLEQRGLDSITIANIAKYSDHMTLLSMPLACAVFDSPFTSIVELIRSIVDKVHKFGGTIIPKFF